MREYSKVSPTFWTGETGRQIRAKGDNAIIVAAYLMTSPGSNMIGLYYLAIPTLAHETGRTSEGALEGLRSLHEIGFAHYDEVRELVWVPEMASYQIGKTLEPKDNRILGIRRELSSYSKSPFFAAFYERYGIPYHLGEAPLPDDSGKGLGRAFGAPPKPGAGAGAGERSGASAAACAGAPDPKPAEAVVPVRAFTLATPIPAVDPYQVNGMDAFEELRGQSENAIRASGGPTQAVKFGEHLTALQRQHHRRDLVPLLAAFAKAGGFAWMTTRLPTTDFLLEHDGAQLTRCVEQALEWDRKGRFVIPKPGPKKGRIAPPASADKFTGPVDLNAALAAHHRRQESGS